MTGFLPGLKESESHLTEIRDTIEENEQKSKHYPDPDMLKRVKFVSTNLAQVSVEKMGPRGNNASRQDEKTVNQIQPHTQRLLSLRTLLSSFAISPLFAQLYLQVLHLAPIAPPNSRT